MFIKEAARARILTRICEIGAVFFAAHLSKGVSARSREVRGPKSEKTIFEIDEIPNLLHPYLLLPRTDRARVTKTENGHKTCRQGSDFDKSL